MKTVFILILLAVLMPARPHLSTEYYGDAVIQNKKKSGKKKSPDGDRILAVLDAQVEAWNAGDLNRFMDGYWQSPELTFYSSSGKLNGWDATLERYRKNYQSEGKEMGRLEFNDLDITLLGPDAAVVRGRWKLSLSSDREMGGLYTLIFRKFKDGWKIIHDHTSAEGN